MAGGGREGGLGIRPCSKLEMAAASGEGLALCACVGRIKAPTPTERYYPTRSPPLKLEKDIEANGLGMERSVQKDTDFSN